MLEGLLKEAAAAATDSKFSLKFLLAEWEQVVDAWQVDNLEAYQGIPRLGRKTRLPESQKNVLWTIFEKLQRDLTAQGLVTSADMFDTLSRHYTNGANSPFDFIVVDESQDINVAQLKFVAALCGQRRNGLFFAGDLGQRIFQQPFSWKSLGVDIRGRSRSLRINYRTSHQIRAQADRLLDPEQLDVDGITESRRGTISVFNGPQPLIRDFDAVENEIQFVSQWIRDLIDAGVEPDEIGVFVRSDNEIPRAQAAIDGISRPFKILDDRVSTTVGYISLCTMHLAKGLEFRAVAVMACDDEVIPEQIRIESVSDEADLEEVYNTERHLLYVACTRARDKLLVTCVKPSSEFLDDLRT